MLMIFFDRQNNDGLRDSLSSDELQQFLQPTRTRQESNGDVGEDRESSASDNEGKQAKHPVVLKTLFLKVILDTDGYIS